MSTQRLTYYDFPSFNSDHEFPKNDLQPYMTAGFHPTESEIQEQMAIRANVVHACAFHLSDGVLPEALITRAPIEVLIQTSDYHNYDFLTLGIHGS